MLRDEAEEAEVDDEAELRRRLRAAKRTGGETLMERDYDMCLWFSR